MIVFVEEGDKKVFKSVSLSLLLLASIVAIAGSAGFGSQHSIVINAIHYDPDVKTELVEFIELHNAGTVDVDLAGWYFTGGISYRFPAGSTLPPGGCIIVAQDPAFIHAKWSSGRLSLPADLGLGSFEGKLDNDGETIRLYSADGREIDKVD